MPFRIANRMLILKALHLSTLFHLISTDIPCVYIRVLSSLIQEDLKPQRRLLISRWLDEPLQGVGWKQH